MPTPVLSRALHFVHQMTACVVRTGDVVVDATVGNGHDTARLAELVGANGQVIGLDVQAEALHQARQRLVKAGLAGQVVLMQSGHEHLAARLSAAGVSSIRAALFNLGYLPGGDKTLVTRPETTIPALQAALNALEPGGLIGIVLYTGHAGGAKEAGAVEAWAASLEQQMVQVLRYGFINQRNHPPYALLIERVVDDAC